MHWLQGHMLDQTQHMAPSSVHWTVSWLQGLYARLYPARGSRASAWPWNQCPGSGLGLPPLDPEPCTSPSTLYLTWHFALELVYGVWLVTWFKNWCQVGPQAPSGSWGLQQAPEQAQLPSCAIDLAQSKISLWFFCLFYFQASLHMLYAGKHGTFHMHFTVLFYSINSITAVGDDFRVSSTKWKLIKYKVQ